MSWVLLMAIAVALGFATVVAWARHADVRRMRRVVVERRVAEETGSAAPRLSHPVVDLSRCMGCATCVAVCPEEGVLEIVHGQAIVVNGARCQGVSACERECPVGAVTVTLADADSRDDIPAVGDDFEAVGAPNVFLAGEVTAHGLVRVAIEHGAAVARAVAARCQDPGATDAVDLAIVGAGPAGLACALEASRVGLTCLLLEQEPFVGGAVARYPRGKLVLTEPVDLPRVGRLKKRSYTKEELISIWQRAVDDHALPIRCGVTFRALDRAADGTLVVRTDGAPVRARHVCLAVGRRGSPRRLGVPGEDLPKVAYALQDAAAVSGEHVLVVGGGDSAVETALACAEQPGNVVTLSYRRERFTRIKSRNRERLEAAVADGAIRLALETEVTAIEPDRVALGAVATGPQGAVAVASDAPVRARRSESPVGAGRVDAPAPPPVGAGSDGAAPPDHATALRNDRVFVMAGGVPPFDLLRAAGVSFDPRLRPAAVAPGERGTGVLPALVAALALTVVTLGFALWHREYYLLPAWERPAHPSHHWLRPGLGLGLALGIASAALIVVNLAYLLRKAAVAGFRFGSLRAWMTVHVATGVLALLTALLHGAMEPRDTSGGHAFWALAVLLVTGAIGRYLYAWVPRAANGRELALADVRAVLDAQVVDAPPGVPPDFAVRARNTVVRLADERQWQGTFFGRVLALCGVQRDLVRALAGLRDEGRARGVDPAALAGTLALARKAHRTALAAAHFEDLRALLGTWRWLHRYAALLMVVLVVVHVVHALLFGTAFSGEVDLGVAPGGGGRR